MAFCTARCFPDEGLRAGRELRANGKAKTLRGVRGTSVTMSSKSSGPLSIRSRPGPSSVQASFVEARRVKTLHGPSALTRPSLTQSW